MSSQSQPTLWQKEDSDASTEASDLGEMGVVDGDDDVTKVATNASQSRESTNYFLVETFGFGERLAHYTPGNVFLKAFEKATIQSACIFEAGTRVFASATARCPDVKDLFEKSHKAVVEELDDSYINDVAKECLWILVGGRQDNSNTPMNGDKLYKKFTEIQHLINKNFTPI